MVVFFLVINVAYASAITLPLPRDGTTDVTRTLHFGTPTAHEKRCFTRVLQGHIALDVAVFPKGTTGTPASLALLQAALRSNTRAQATNWIYWLDFPCGRTALTIATELVMASAPS